MIKITNIFNEIPEEYKYNNILIPIYNKLIEKQ